MALTYALFDLAAHPEWQEILREEIHIVLQEDGNEHGMLTRKSVPKLRKLDSFIKESQRVSPPFLSMYKQIPRGSKANEL